MTSETIDWRSLKGLNDITRPLIASVVERVEKVNAYNAAHASDSKGVTTLDIQKTLRKFADPESGESTEDKDVLAQAKAFAKAEAAFKAAAKSAVKVYRTNVLKQEVSDEPDADEAEIREERKIAYDTIALVVNMAKAAGKTDVVEWANRYPIPQVGRDGVSTVGSVKPRAQVVMGDGDNRVVWDSFSAAAKGLTSVLPEAISTNDLTQAWVDDGQPVNSDWVFHNTKLTVIPKETAKK